MIEKNPGCLNTGMEIEVGEGSNLIGIAKTIKVYNELLVKNN